MSCDHRYVTQGCPNCEQELQDIQADAKAPTYTDDVVAVMRDTITAQRETIEAKSATILELREALRRSHRTIAACPSCTGHVLRGERT